MEYETYNNGIMYALNNDGTYSELGTMEDLDITYTEPSGNTEEFKNFISDTEYSFTATITDSTGFEDWFELWNRQCVWNTLLAAELYDIDGLSQDGYREMEPIVKSPEPEADSDEPDSIFTYDELQRRMLETYIYCVLMASQLYTFDGEWECV